MADDGDRKKSLASESVTNDYDSPWKEILETYFEECMAFFFPDVHRDIDWSRDHEFLDKELQQVTKDAKVGKRIADKLVEVWRVSGEQVWVLVHIEVQSQSETAFEERVYVYNYRLRDQFNRPVASFAILSDSTISWRPQSFVAELWGCSVDFKFRTVKLLDYKQQWDELLASDNPFAIVVMTHLKGQETVGDNLNRKQWKLRLIKQLYERDYSRKDISQLFAFIDWLISLPTELNAELWQEVRTYREESKMRYITSFERFAAAEAKEEGLVEGLRKGLLLAVDIAHGSEGLGLAREIEKIEDPQILETLQQGLRDRLSLDELRSLYTQKD